MLVAARDLFGAVGYAATSVSDVARQAGVPVDTVYASVGRKPQLLLAAIDMALAGGHDPVPAEERDYVRAIRAAPSDDDVADLVWSTNAVEYDDLLTSRGWDAERFAGLLRDLWTRVLLA